MRTYLHIAIVYAVGLSLIPSGRAQSTAETTVDRSADVEQIADQARNAYSQGRFSDAIAAYLQAYQIIPTAALLYNVAFIYDSKLKEPKIASTFYRRYIEAPDADPAVVGRATERLSELGESTSKTIETERNKPKVAIVPIDDDEPPLLPTVDATPEQTIGPLQLAGWTTLGVGVASLAAATTFAVLAKGNQDTFDSATSLDKRLDARETGENQALTADILFGVGGAAVVTGIVLLFIPDDEDAAVSPTVSTVSDGRNHMVLFHTHF